MNLTPAQLDTLARLIVVEILNHGLKESTFAELYPKAYIALGLYRVDLENSVQKVLKRVQI